MHRVRNTEGVYFKSEPNEEMVEKPKSASPYGIQGRVLRGRRNRYMEVLVGSDLVEDLGT